MIIVHIKLSVINFDALKQFECKAVQLMEKYQGQVIAAFEISRNKNGTGTEIHIYKREVLG